jgi:hypothetical protein
LAGGLTAGAVFFRRPFRLVDERSDRLSDLGVVLLEDPAEGQSESLEIPEGLLDHLVALGGPFINFGELLGGMEIPVTRRRFVPPQAPGSAAVFTSHLPRQERVHRRIGGTFGAL